MHALTTQLPPGAAQNAAARSSSVWQATRTISVALTSLTLLACSTSGATAPAGAESRSVPAPVEQQAAPVEQKAAPGSVSASANTAEGASSAPATLTRIDVATLRQKLQEQPTLNLIDVRTPEEFASGHVAGARNIPLDQLESRLSELGDAPVYLICRSGNRSGKAGELLVARGRSATNIEGGTSAWVAAGHPVQ